MRGTSISRRSTERRLDRPVTSATGKHDLSKVGWASATDTVEGSDSHLIYPYIVSAEILVASEAHHEGLA